jgi:hypothetical protein
MHVIDRWDLFLMLLGACTLVWVASDIFFLLLLGVCNFLLWFRKE